MFTQKFDNYVCEGDSITCEIDGFTLTARVYRDDCGDAPDWNYGATLINEDYWEDYAQELVKDIGDLPRDLPDYLEIDWKATAANLLADYTSVEFKDKTFYVR